MIAVNDEGPSILMMIGFVALVVATVILVFFGIGYLLGGLPVVGPRTRTLAAAHGRSPSSASPRRLEPCREPAAALPGGLYFALVYWTYADAKRRIRTRCWSVSAAGAPLPVRGRDRLRDRPSPEYLDDARERELEIAAAEAPLAQVQALACRTVAWRSSGASCVARAACSS